MTSELIKIYNHADSRIADLLAEIDKRRGHKIYDLNGNELKLIFCEMKFTIIKLGGIFRKTK